MTYDVSGVEEEHPLTSRESAMSFSARDSFLIVVLRIDFQPPDLMFLANAITVKY
jgi:hypothetical protein